MRAFAVRGDFDDCQRVVKEAFCDIKTKSKFSLISANSINVARLLPQTVYYAASSLVYLARHGKAAGYIIPSGNLGNAVAAFWARKMGFPIREVLLSTNANRSLHDFFETGVYQPRQTVATLANAMDVGSPNNMERLLALHPDFNELKKFASAISVDDPAIRKTIAGAYQKWKRHFCPHTATALYARETRSTSHWIIVATAHAAKFASVVGSQIETPPALESILRAKPQFIEIDPTLEDLVSNL